MTIKKFVKLFDKKSIEKGLEFYVVANNSMQNIYLKLTPEVLESFIGKIEIDKNSIFLIDELVTGIVIPIDIHESTLVSLKQFDKDDWAECITSSIIYV